MTTTTDQVDLITYLERERLRYATIAADLATMLGRDIPRSVKRGVRTKMVEALTTARVYEARLVDAQSK